jgi:hypothetical protein
MWAKVKYGDVHGLIEAIKTRFRLDDEKDAEIAIKKMNEIVKQKDETFDAFLDRFDKQLTDLTDVVELDSKQIEYYARKSMRESNDTDMHEVRENVITMQPDLKEERVIMEHMRKIMKMRESKLKKNQTELRNELNRKDNEKEKVMKTQILEMTKKMDDMTKMMSEMQKKQS